MNIKKYLSFFDNKKPSSPSEFRQSGPGRRSGPLPGRRRRGGDDAVHDEFREAAPGQGAEILLVVQFDRAAALQHQPPGQLRVAHRKFEFVGLDRPGRLRADARLDELAFVGFENHAFVNDIIQFAALHALAEDEVEAEVDEQREGGEDDGRRDDPEFFHGFAVRYRP